MSDLSRAAKWCPVANKKKKKDKVKESPRINMRVSSLEKTKAVKDWQNMRHVTRVGHVKR